MGGAGLESWRAWAGLEVALHSLYCGRCRPPVCWIFVVDSTWYVGGRVELDEDRAEAEIKSGKGFRGRAPR